jgi:hypothetical protein
MIEEANSTAFSTGSAWKINSVKYASNEKLWEN